MIDVRKLANNAIQTVNKDNIITIRKSTGYTIGEGRKQIPTYSDYRGNAQIQALDNKAMQKVNALNMQGAARALYLTGELHGIIRDDEIGNDLVLWNGKTWLVALVLETWETWSKVAIIQQVSTNE